MNGTMSLSEAEGMLHILMAACLPNLLLFTFHLIIVLFWGYLFFSLLLVCYPCLFSFSDLSPFLLRIQEPWQSSLSPIYHEYIHSSTHHAGVVLVSVWRISSTHLHCLYVLT